MAGFIKKIVSVTGTRADYSHYFSIYKKLNRKYDLSLIVCGMHLSGEYGHTNKEIIKDGFNVADEIDFLFDSNTHASMSRSIGLAILGMTQTLERIKPDLLLLLGDRGEMLAAATCASYMNIPIAHIHGGEVSGSIDDNIRHCITKLAHIHFTPHEVARLRVIQMGENPKYVFNVGSPSLDSILNLKLASVKEIYKKYDLKSGEPFFMSIFHPTTTDSESPMDQVSILLEGLSKFKIKTIAIKSNSDTGGKEINSVLEDFSKRNSWFKLYPNLPYLDYLSLLKSSSLLIGNSSSGIIEAASFKTPVVNIGNRQVGRLRSGNVIDVEYSNEKIVKAIDKVFGDQKYGNVLKSLKNPYGDGKTSDKIFKILPTLTNKEEILNKTFFDQRNIQVK
jgi:GDP/UDP-N,N'-diacetylbacillosamine 2-epimerase (hydrolysing)